MSSEKSRGHGTVYCYSVKRCRRPECRAAWAKYIFDRRRATHPPRQRFERQLAQLDRELSHAVESVKVPVTISPLAAQILRQLQASTKSERDEIFDRLLRDHGHELAHAS